MRQRGFPIFERELTNSQSLQRTISSLGQTNPMYEIDHSDFKSMLQVLLLTDWPVDTMMKFASFEKTVELIYDYLPGKKSDYGSAAQTAVSFGGGYIAGILCAIVSHPADVCYSHTPIPFTTCRYID